MVAMATSFERSQPHFTAIIYTRNATNPENFAKIGRVRSEIIGLEPIVNKKLSYRRVTARCVLSVVFLPITTQQCRNYLYDKS